MGAKNLEARQLDDVRQAVNASSKADATAGVDTNGLQRLREILVGNYMRETEKRSQQFERHITDETSSARRDIITRIEGLEKRLQEELSAVEIRQREERSARQKDVERLHEAIGNLEKEMRQNFHQSSKESADALYQVRAEVMNRMGEDRQTWEKNKVDRTDLASMFADIVSRLGLVEDSPASRQ